MEAINNFISQFSKFDLDIHGVRLPSFEIEKKYKRKIGAPDDCDNFFFLEALCKEGILKRRTDSKEYLDRLNYELEILKDLGFIDYILLVWDVINFCKENSIPTGLGRGSAAGSLVLYLIGVTRIDPLKYGLYFERFVSKIRAKKQVVNGVTYLDGSLMCDVDLDIDYYQRHKVIEYLENKFQGKTCKILTLNTLSSKLLIKECGKIVGEKSEQEMNAVSSLIPTVFSLAKGIEESMTEVEDFKKWCETNQEVTKTALKLRDLIKNKGVHPSAVSISFDNLEDNCPIELTSSKEGFVSSYDMSWTSLFNVKLDILGLRSVSVVDDACKSIGIDLEKIDLEDPIIYQNLQDLQSQHGLFQIEADTNYKVCNKVKPKNLDELSAVLALARPGALDYVDQYSLYANTKTSQSIHPFFDDILGSTGGVCLYQEQMMKMANKIGFTLDEAEVLRRIVGKKKVEEVKAWKEKISTKIKEHKLQSEIGDILWKVLEDSANYSFNRSHSSAYAALAAITIYLKFKYPKDFFLSLLKMTRHEPDPIGEISKIQREMASFNMKLLPPHIVKSGMDFQIEGNDIRFGLLSIKGISDKSIEKLNKFKNQYSNKFEILEAASEAGLGIGIVCALIQAGALEGFKQSRTKVVFEAQLWNILTEKEKRFCIPLADKHDCDLVAVIKTLSSSKDEKGKPLIKESRIETIKKKCGPYRDIYNQNKVSESFANWYYEKMLLGYTYGKTLKDIFLSKKEDLIHINEVKGARTNSRISFVGVIEDKPYKGISKSKGNKYMRIKISDETSLIEAMIFNDKMEYSNQMNGGDPKEGDIVIIKGIKKDDKVFADLIAIQNNKVYTKLSDLKKTEE